MWEYVSSVRESIKNSYKDHVANALSEKINKHIIGFNYHRKYNYYIKFDLDFTLKETFRKYGQGVRSNYEGKAREDILRRVIRRNHIRDLEEHF